MPALLAIRECTPTCNLYGVHDLRRFYATESCDRTPLPVLQKKMRHTDVQTMMRCVEMANRMKRAAETVDHGRISRRCCPEISQLEFDSPGSAEGGS